MHTSNMHEAKTHLSRLVEAAANGEPFIIARAGKPVVLNLFLDTHVLLWAAGASRRLLDDGRTLLEDPENKLFFSATSLGR